MPVGGQVRIDGLRELRRDLKAIDKKLPRELNQRLKKVAEPIRADAAIRAPRRTGRLAGSLKVRTSGSKVFIGSRLPYARIIHYGGRHPVFGNRERWAFQPPRPFIEQAARGRAHQVENEIFDAVEDLMKKAGFTHG
jgi:HK97 gp10 family phage protein